MPAFSLTTPLKVANTESVPATPASRSLLPSKSKAQDSTAPISRTRANTHTVKPKAPPPSDRSQTRSPSTSESDSESETTPVPTARSKRKSALSLALKSPLPLTSPPPLAPHSHSQRERIVSRQNKSARSSAVFPPPSTTTEERSPSASAAAFSSNVDAKATLEILSDIITSEVTYWAHYIATVSQQRLSSNGHVEVSVATSPHSAVGSSGDGTDAAETGNDEEQQEHKQKQTQKSTALSYVLETLPLRFQALASAYGAFNGATITGNDDMMVLGDDLQRLLTLSQGTMVDGEQEEHSQFEGWYDPKFFQNRKIKAMDDEVRRLEASRMEELEALLLMAEELKLAVEDGSLVGNHPALRSLVEAMDEVGMSAADTSASTPSSSMSGISGVGRTH
ncbi:hypothetical protein SMMN14_01874 [Sphaerulina musiva]